MSPDIESHKGKVGTIPTERENVEVDDLAGLDATCL
jgi:hypothetical protein